MSELFTSVERLSLNQITTNQWNLQEAIEGCVKAGVPSIALWRNKVEEFGLKESARIVKESGLKVSSLCRGGMFPAATKEERAERIEDNRRAIVEAAELGTEVLVLVCGPAADKNIEEARKQVQEGIEAIVPFAEEHRVTLGIEPLHPMYAAERSVINSLKQANDLAEQFTAEQVGVVIDTFHVWWDPELYSQIERSAGRILGFHVSDWLVPMPDMLLGRGMMGDGVIDIHKIRKAVDAAGYKDAIEVEIFNQEIWDQPGEKVLETMKARYLQYV